MASFQLPLQGRMILTQPTAHVTDIFSLAVTPTQVLSASGASSIKIYSTTSPDIPLAQTLTGAHKLGCHHIVTSRNGRIAASAGFGGEVKIWGISEEGEWIEQGKIVDGNAAGETWAIALSEDGHFLGSTTYDGRINIWDLVDGRKKIREYETKGSFGMCIDMSRDGKFTASGHENGGVYVFNNDTGRMLYSLPGKLICLSYFHVFNDEKVLLSRYGQLHSLLLVLDLQLLVTLESLHYMMFSMASKLQILLVILRGSSRLTGVILASIF
jgi:WD40 repeat protein